MKGFQGNTLKVIMKERGMNASALSKITGIGKPSISGYVNGKVNPSTERLQIIAEALGCTVDDLCVEYQTEPMTEQETPVIQTQKMTCAQAAALMHKHESFIRRGLRDGVLPFGYAVKGNSNKYSYYISPIKFTEFTGIRV